MIAHLDHLVLTTNHEDACVDFYTRVLGMELETFIGGTPPTPQRALRFGQQMISLHVNGADLEPRAHRPTPGSLDLCFLAHVPMEAVMRRLNELRWPVVEGPVLRTGATSKTISIYVRDPDQNLIEISEPIDRSASDKPGHNPGKKSSWTVTNA